MKQIKSSAALKADARQQLLGKYKTVILAYLIMQFLISGCMNLAQAQVNLNTGAGMGIYYLIYSRSSSPDRTSSIRTLPAVFPIMSKICGSAFTDWQTMRSWYI